MSTVLLAVRSRARQSVEAIEIGMMQIIGRRISRQSIVFFNATLWRARLRFLLDSDF